MARFDDLQHPAIDALVDPEDVFKAIDAVPGVFRNAGNASLLQDSVRKYDDAYQALHKARDGLRDKVAACQANPDLKTHSAMLHAWFAMFRPLKDVRKAASTLLGRAVLLPSTHADQ